MYIGIDGFAPYMKHMLHRSLSLSLYIYIYMYIYTPYDSIYRVYRDFIYKMYTLEPFFLRELGSQACQHHIAILDNSQRHA